MPRMSAQRPSTARGRSAPARRPAPSRTRQRMIRFGLPGAALVLLLSFGTWAWASGWAATTATRLNEGFWRMTADAGFSVQEVLVVGRGETDRDRILAALGIERGDPILRFDPDDAHAALAALSWVRSATVERRLPDTIFIRLEERRPLAIWQNEHDLKVIDQDGRVLADSGVAAFSDLPLLVGPDVPEHAASFLSLVHGEPTIGRRMDAAVRVSGRRWDLHLKNGVTIRLPEGDEAEALARLADAAATSELFERDIVAIDLRLADRLVIQTSPMAAERRRLPEENT